MNDADYDPPSVIPSKALSADALRGVIEAFILREGTDYGELETDFETKVTQVLRQLDQGEAQILYDPESQTIDIQQVP
jgi:uncharacterized protein